MTECHQGVFSHGRREKWSHRGNTYSNTHKQNITYTHFSFCTAAEVGGKITYTQAHTHTSTGANKKKDKQVYVQRILQCPPHLPTQVFLGNKNETGKNLGQGRVGKRGKGEACMHAHTDTTPQCKRVGMGARIITLCCTADWHASAARSVCSVDESCPAACALSSGGRLARLRCRQVLAPAWSQ